MDSISVDDDKININKKYLVVKIPANVENRERCIELLGGKDKIATKFVKNEDIELSLFLKRIPLEKCWTNDVLMRRKRMRNKRNPNEIKYKYEPVGRIDSIYDFFAMHDFICVNPEKKNFDLDVIEKFIIKPEEETGILSNGGNNFDGGDSDNENGREKDYLNSNEVENDLNDGNGSKKPTYRDKTIHAIKNIIKNKIEENSIKAENIFNFLQPEKYSYGRNMYPHSFKELESIVKYKTKKEF